MEDYVFFSPTLQCLTDTGGHAKYPLTGLGLYTGQDPAAASPPPHTPLPPNIMPQASEVISLGCCLRQPQARHLLINWLCEYLSTSLTFIIANLGKKKTKKQVNVHLCLPLCISCFVLLPFWATQSLVIFRPCSIRLQPVNFSALSLYFDMSAQ